MPELLAGAAAAALGASAAALVRSQRTGLAVLDRELIWAARGVPWTALTNSVAVYGRLLRGLLQGRRVSGRVRAYHFDPGGEDRRSVARRALQDYVTCLTPLTLSFGVDRERGLLLMHELAGEDEEGPGLQVRL